ncbi:MAG: hypothetical protein KY476_19050 [Planctomycetes bacterium]|nr:hypothetical protein [Planctomycetota bacterium]
MKRVSLDAATSAVKRFVRDLPLDDEGVELELEGEVVCEVLPPQSGSDAARQALIDRGRELARRARSRNKGVPARVIEREVRDAIDEVRRRQAK